MNDKALPISFARCLKRMLEGEPLNSSEIASKNLLKHFVEDGILQKIPAGTRRMRYSCHQPEILRNYLNNQYGILDLEEYLRLSDLNSVDGQDALVATKSSKSFRTGSIQGFFIKAFRTKVMIDSTPLPVLPDGSEIFIHQPEKLKVSPRTLVVGIENPECFVKIDQLLHLFPHKELLFVLRYLSNSPVNWLKTIPNPYLHFGDFDPAGIWIYINEYLNRLGKQRCNFFIPENLAPLIHLFGSRKLFDQQVHLLDHLPENTSELEQLITLLKKYGKGLEQERLLLVD